MSKIATKEQLEFELFLRMREQNLIVWKTKSNETIPIKQLKNEHLVNILNKISEIEENKCIYEQEKAEYEAFIFDKF